MSEVNIMSDNISNHSVVKISVRNLVEFIFRAGDLDNRYGGMSDAETMAAGSKLHRKIQGRMGSSYHAEMPLRIQISYDELDIIVEGRADGIIDGDIITIDEIKGVKKSIEFIKEPVFVHKAQAMCYAYIYANEKELSDINVQLTYANLETEEIKRFSYKMTFDYLKEWFTDLVNKYYVWAEFDKKNRKITMASAKMINFPYEYRKGQKEIAVNIYKAIDRKVPLYVQAPTGVGKTLSTIFPSVKAIGEGLVDKIFYLTAKTITRTVAMDTYKLLRDNGLNIKSIVLTAKEKICVCDEVNCNPVACERAKGHFDRINDAVFDIITHEDDISREKILEYSEKHMVCPFEMGLDISLWVNGIICDYNYAFDPRAKLKRYFGENVQGKYVFLVDEAHNLVDRAREMYSACLCKEDVLSVKKIFLLNDKRIVSNLDKVNKAMLKLKRQCDTGFSEIYSVDDMIAPLLRFTSAFEKYSEEHQDYEGKEESLDLYFNAKGFLDVLDVMDENYKMYCEINNRGDFYVNLMCINPKERLKECLFTAVSTIFFSATMLPVNYYKMLFTGNVDDYAVYIDSPFDKKNRLIAIGSDVTSRYTRRGKSEYKKIATYIYRIISAKPGNYMVFFPSYKMLEEVYQMAIELQIEKEATIVCQKNSMSEEEKEEFLQSFDEENELTHVGMCVMGGIFSEGIDLKNDRLIGTIIVGTGLPQICNERELIAEYFKENSMNGFDYSYKIPGMNKVMQAAGRVIRTDEDKGVIVLLDDRFLEYSYRQMFPREWDDIVVTNVDSVEDTIRHWWKT